MVLKEENEVKMQISQSVKKHMKWQCQLRSRSLSWSECNVKKVNKTIYMIVIIDLIGSLFSQSLMFSWHFKGMNANERFVTNLKTRVIHIQKFN